MAMCEWCEAIIEVPFNTTGGKLCAPCLNSEELYVCLECNHVDEFGGDPEMHRRYQDMHLCGACGAVDSLKLVEVK